MAMQPAVGMVPMQVAVPHDAVVGQSIQILVNGQTMAVVVPPGVPPGGSMTIQVPDAQVKTATAQAVPAVQAQPVAQPGGVMMGFVLD